MVIKEIWEKIKKGVKAGMAAVKESNVLTDNRIVRLIDEFQESDKKKWMCTGEKYYQVENDILTHKNIRTVDGKSIEESYKANNKIAHAKYKNQVDEKVAYLLSKPVAFQCDENNFAYTEKIQGVLGKHFQHQLTEMGYEASNKGISWLHIYVNEKGEFATTVIPAEQCIPVWKNSGHTVLEMLIRSYTEEVWESDTRKAITNVEVWTEEGVTYYRLDGKMLIYDVESSEDEYGPVSHLKTPEGWIPWGRIPFVAFKNNWKEIPDIKFVKSLVDAYDSGRSEAANYVEEVKNLIYVLKGYGGEDIREFMRDLNENRAIKVDDVEEGGVDTITPQMDITALREHYEQLKKDLIEDGQAINNDPDKFGNSPSGIALRFMYARLDLKCNLLEAEFKIGFENLLYFVDEYLKLTSVGDFTAIEADIIFDRNMAMNEAEQIQNCTNSRGMISDRTILARHPYVSNVEKELEAIKQQAAEEEPAWDAVPVEPEEE